MNNLKNNYEDACNAYLKAFCDKHDFEFVDAYWISFDTGGMVDVCGYFVGMETIKSDIDSNAPENLFVEWYDYGERLRSISSEILVPNFENWIKGCPRRSEEEIQELEALHRSKGCVGEYNQ